VPLTCAPGRIRTCVVRIRSPLPHPLGHGGNGGGYLYLSSILWKSNHQPCEETVMAFERAQLQKAI
jgi:hypothetical protein